MPRRHTILVVDDEPDVVKSVQDLLRLDHRVLGATRAEDGIKLMQQEDVHVVMSDQRMPGMTGVQFLNQVRGEHPDAVRLLFTGYADIKAVVDAINEGNVYRYITKPWDPDELQTIIREAVERYDLLAERKRLVEELKQKNEELEKANAELKENDSLKSAFIQVASHELRTPLTILLGLTKLASKANGVAPPLSDWLKRIDSAALRLQYLVSQLITMLASGRFDATLEKKPEDLSKLLLTGAEDVRPFLELRHQNLAVDVPEDLGTFDVDGAKVRDSINHLLLNAVKFTADGGSITLAARRAEDGGAEIRVGDTGIGIDRECLPRIFQPFFTGFDVSRHSSGTFEYCRRGLGLGLSVVKEFVELHGGTVRVDSEAGQGTTFTIRLPRELAK
jgi:signal transduction histidine kinase